MVIPPTVLVIEDELELLETILECLTDEGISARGCQTLAEAEAEIAQAPPAILVLDLWLGDNDGLVWLKRTTLLPESTQIVMATARTGTAARIAGINGGADVYLEKPVALEELLAVIRRLSERMLPLLAEVWHFKRSEFALIAPDGQRAKLTAGQCRLLDALGQAADCTCSRDDLIKALGHDPSYFTDKRLEVAIRRLRLAIEQQCGPHHPIETVYGWGYAFSAPLECHP